MESAITLGLVGLAGKCRERGGFGWWWGGFFWPTTYTVAVFCWSWARSASTSLRSLMHLFFHTAAEVLMMVGCDENDEVVFFAILTTMLP